MLSERANLQDPHVALQIQCAVRTSILCHPRSNLKIIFLRNETGQPRSAEVLPHGNVFKSQSVLCTIEVQQPEGFVDEKILVAWIDDLSIIPPAHNPYNSRLKRHLHERNPVLLDWLRQLNTDRLDRKKAEYLKSLVDPTSTLQVKEKAVVSKRRSILFCLYWLDVGGAESFALHCMKIAKEQGFEVVVTCDEPSRLRLLKKVADVADVIYAFGEFGTHLSKDEMLLRVINAHDPAIIHIHHSWIMYRLTPVIKNVRSVKIVDTVHILEHRRHDFVSESVAFSRFVDTHHVISQNLRTMYEGYFADAGHKVVLGLLSDMSKQYSGNVEKWQATVPLRVAFIGRLTQQKRPYLFVEIARRLLKKFGDTKFEFTMVGEGELQSTVGGQISEAGIEARVRRLPSSADVEAVLSQAHVLVICSDNEGIALVGFEALRSKCLVISCDVGAQDELICPELLVPRDPYKCVSRTVDLLSRLGNDRELATGLLERQDVFLRKAEAMPVSRDAITQIYQATGS